MEAAAGVAAAARGVSLPLSTSQPSRKEWRVVSEQSVRGSANEEMDRSKIVQSDERLIYEVQQGREPVDVDFCSITIDGSSDNDILQQRLRTLVKQREELEHMEIELRAQLIARSEIMEMQSSYDAQMKEHANANVKLQEQLHEREQKIHELERKMEEKERELHAIRLDTEAAWAKEDLLREQSKELQSFRRERDNSEAERAQHVKQIHDLQEHIREKEAQFMELQEQHRIAQDAIMFKDEQLREAQAWITRVQEMDALQSTTHHSLQAELRERTEQYNQLWLGCQRQFAEMERLHMHVQQLQLELADARERGGTFSESSHASQANPTDASHLAQSNGNQLDMNGKTPPNGSTSSLSNGNADNASFASIGNVPAQTEQANGLPVVPSSILGMSAYLPPGQVTALHPFVMHQQGVPQSVPSHVPQTHVGHFHSVPQMSSLQHWQNQQSVSEGPQMPSHNQYPHVQSESNLLRSDSSYNYEASLNGQGLRPDYLGVNISQGAQPDSVVPPNKEGHVLESIDKNYLGGSQTQQSLQEISSQFHDALRLNTLDQNRESKENRERISSNHGAESQPFMGEQSSSVAETPPSEVPSFSANFKENTVANDVLSEGYTGQKNTYAVGKPSDPVLLDERSLLACIVRTIPPGSGGRIRISSTLPNRLGKMLAPLHWHDYKKKYGKLDDFVASHPELFVVDGDYIQLREGAQEIIAATAAVAKVAAAAATSYSSLLPSVAVTPMAQPHRLKKTSSNDMSPQTNGVSFGVAGGASNFKILSKPKDHMEMNGSTHGRSGATSAGSQQGRLIAASSSLRR